MNTIFILIQRLLPHHGLSRLVGFFANSRIRWLKNFAIRGFIYAYDIDMSPYQRQQAAQFVTFNDFFTRELIEGTRTINGIVTSPADGTVSAVGRIENNQIFQAKGLSYSLEKLLAGSFSDRFIDGSFVTIYLAPNNYHRVHLPGHGRLHDCRYLPGKLFSVNQVTAENVPDLFAGNERLVCELEIDDSAFAVVMVGAMIVAGIQPAWREQPYPPGRFVHEQFDPPRQFSKGDELGQFHLGSTVILLYKGKVDWRVAAGDLVNYGDALA